MPKYKMGKASPKPKDAYAPTKKLPKTVKSATPRTPGRSLEAGTGTVFKRTVTVDNATWEALKQLGGGDFSRGIREAARTLVKRGTIQRKTTPLLDDVTDLV